MNLWKFHILHPNSTHLPVPSYPLSTLQCSLPPKNKPKPSEQKQKECTLIFVTQCGIKRTFFLVFSLNITYHTFHLEFTRWNTFSTLLPKINSFLAVNFFCPNLLAIYLHYILQDNYLILCLRTLYFILDSRACVLIQNTYCYTPVEQVKWRNLTIDRIHLT